MSCDDLIIVFDDKFYRVLIQVSQGRVVGGAFGTPLSRFHTIEIQGDVIRLVGELSQLRLGSKFVGTSETCGVGKVVAGSRVAS